MSLATESLVDTEQLSQLRSGDHLDQPTFHAIYERMPDHFKDDLVDGVVIVQAAASNYHVDFTELSSPG